MIEVLEEIHDKLEVLHRNAFRAGQARPLTYSGTEEFARARGLSEALRVVESAIDKAKRARRARRRKA